MESMNPNKGNVQGIALGDTARDIVTEYEGVVIAISTWLNGCVRITLQARGLKDGKPFEHHGCDVEQLVLVKRSAEAMPTKKAGGPMPEPMRNADPVR